MNETGQFEIYQADNGQTQIQVRLESDTLWLTQKQMSGLFQVTTPTINEHVKHIYDEGELHREISPPGCGTALRSRAGPVLPGSVR